MTRCFLLTWIRGLALIYAPLVKGPHRNAAIYYPIKSSLFAGADGSETHGAFPPYLREGVAAERKPSSMAATRGFFSLTVGFPVGHLGRNLLARHLARGVSDGLLVQALCLPLGLFLLLAPRSPDPLAGGITTIGKAPFGRSAGMLVTVASSVRGDCTAHHHHGFLQSYPLQCSLH